VIITDQFDLAGAAAQIMTIKTMNGGQICLAPDYVYVPSAKKRAFVDAAVAASRQMFPDGVHSATYTSIITDRHYQRLQALVDDASAKGAEVIHALTASDVDKDRRFSPTLLLDATSDMKAMQEEIFGPILPIIGYEDLDEVLAKIRSVPHPLALYYFGEDDETARKVLDVTVSGGVTINDVMTHAFSEDLPFGGVGASGMGAYHGVTGFRTFSHARGIYRQSSGPEASTLFRKSFEQFASQTI
jgi:coniferyl-aldehyde dehydrogenase